MNRGRMGVAGAVLVAAVAGQGCWHRRVPAEALLEHGAAPPRAMAGPASPRAADLPELSAASLTLRQALEWALLHNLRLSIERLTPDVRDAQIVEALSAFDTVFAGSVSFSEAETPISTPLEGATALVSETSAAELGLQKRLVSGAQAQIGFDWNHAATSSTFADPNPRNQSNFRLGLNQPLLRNFGVGVNTAAIRIARNVKTGSVYDFRKTVEDTLSQVEETYWLLYLAIEEGRVRRRQLERAEDLLRRAKTLVEAGRAPRVDETTAQAEVARVKSDIVTSDNTIRRAEDILKRLINHPDLPVGSRTRLVPVDGPGDTVPEPDREEAVAIALAKRPDLRAAELERANADLRVRVARNQRLPRLDLGIEWFTHGQDRDTERSLQDNIQADLQELRVALLLEIPLGNRAARSRYLQARLVAEQHARTVEDLRQQVALEVKRVLDDLETDRQSILARREAARLSRERLQDEDALYRAGKSTRTDLIQAQTDVAESELDEIRAIIGLMINLERFRRAQGTFLEASRIEIEAVPGS